VRELLLVAQLGPAKDLCHFHPPVVFRYSSFVAFLEVTKKKSWIYDEHD
jgi:hypothetical protein